MKYGIIDYDVIGTGIPVLIIHGWGISKITMKGAFEPVFTKLDGYKRFYIDLPGMGNSAKGDVKNSDDMLEILHDLMEKYINSTYCAVERAGHNLQIEQPEIFVNLVKNWLLTH